MSAHTEHAEHADAYANIKRYLETTRDQQVQFLAELVKVPSDTPPGDNAQAAERALELLRDVGLTAQRHPVDAAFLRPYGMQSVTNLIVRHAFGPGGPTIALNAHGDVVPPGDGWTKPPYGAVVEHDHMYGRGVAVSKSDIATYAFALLALKQLGLSRGTVELHLTYDEEFGGLAGPGWLLNNAITRPDLVISAGFSYAIVTAHNGCLQLQVTLHGRSGHAAMPESGRDALRAAVIVLDQLYAYASGLQQYRSAVPGITHPTLNVGTISGGFATNVVPDKVTLSIDRRLIPEETSGTVEAELRSLIESAVAAMDGITVEIRRTLLAEALMPRPGHERLVAALATHAHRVMGETIVATGTPIYTDARLYGQAGIPTVLYGAGPRSILEANAKRPDENLALGDLASATEVVACAVHDLLLNE